MPRVRMQGIWLALLLVLGSIFPAALAHAETVKDLPTPSGYVNDFAGVLSSTTKSQLEALCTQVDQQAHTQVAVVTIKTLNDEPIDQFANDLFVKWGIGAKGTDKGVLLLFAIQDRRYRIEVGYGVEGILPDGKVGDIGRTMVPYLRQGDYNSAVSLGTVQVAKVIAADAGVTLTAPMPSAAEREQSQTQLGLGHFIVLAIIFFVLVMIVGRTGPSGLLWFLLGNLLGGGFGGGGGRNDDRGGFGGRGGGGFGGFGGGSSGGGGASGNW